ncbi:MAG TPA: hypothetical protein VM619_13855 [Luteimonas sp.]|nr:hypothetical protein [Luteimonas sp.]
MKRFESWLAALLLAVVAVPIAVPVPAQERSYADGPVVVVSAIKVMDGQFENYMAYLDGNWRRLMDESKKAGLVMDYHVYSATAHNPNEADLYLVVQYPNMAAFDGFDERMDPIVARVTKMDFRKADEASGRRTPMRTLLGQEVLRELVFK